MFIGSFTATVAANTEWERDEMLERLAIHLSKHQEELRIGGWSDTENKDEVSGSSDDEYDDAEFPRADWENQVGEGNEGRTYRRWLKAKRREKETNGS